MVLRDEDRYDSQWVATVSISEKLRLTAESSRRCVSSVVTG